MSRTPFLFPAPAGLLLITACTGDPGSPEGDPPGLHDDSGSTDGGNTDGGDTDGGNTDGGNTDGGSPDGGGLDSARFDVSVSLASDIDPDAPTTVGIVTWSLGDQEIEAAEIHFGLDRQYGMVAPVDLEAPNHRTLLLGMKPESTYHFQIVATVDGQRLTSEDATIRTGAPPPIRTPTVTRTEGSEYGFMVATEFGLPAEARQGWVTIVDSDGDLVWWYRAHFVTDDGRQDSANAARMSYDGRSMWMLSYEPGAHTLERVSMDTLEYELFAEPHASHDLAALDNGDCVAFLAYTARAGKVREICAGDTESRLLSDISTQGGTADHLNAIRFKPDENLLMVSDHLFDVYAVDRASGDVLWRLSDRTESSWGGRQHGVELLDDSVLLFANQGAGPEESLAVEYSRSTGEELFRYDSGLFTHQLGDVQRLPGGNTLVTYSAIGVRHEVTPDGEVVMEMDGPNTGYGWWRASLYGPPPPQ